MAINKTRRTSRIIDVSVPLDWKANDKEDDKMLKYQQLRIEIHQLCNIKAKVIPIIVGSLGVTSTNFELTS